MAESDDDSFNDSEYDEYDENESENLTQMLVIPKTSSQPYQSFTPEQIFVHIMNNALSLQQQIPVLINLSDEECVILYRFYEFNQSNVLRAFSQVNRDSNMLLQSCGLLTNFSTGEPLEDKIVECPSCLDDVPVQDTAKLDCGHTFCHDCWVEYTENFVRTQGVGNSICCCPQADCHMVITQAFLAQLPFENMVTVLQKFKKFTVDGFIATNQPSWKNCPGLNCNCTIQIINAEEIPQCTLICENKHRFCALCGFEDHAPVDCNLLQEWLGKCEGESESAQWIISNTKKCPKCFTRIEKDHGCNHMKCYKCRYEFCWVCMGNWEDHGQRTGGFYKCNRYKAKRTHMLGPQTTEEELDRYLHYYNRYANHDASRRFLQKHRQQLQEKMSELQTLNSSLNWSDVVFIQEAGEQVERCRQILKYTYVFGYYLREATAEEIELFEYLQEQLEQNTEILHEMTEQSLDGMNRIEMINYTRITGQFAERLLEGVVNGLTATQI